MGRPAETPAPAPAPEPLAPAASRPATPTDSPSATTPQHVTPAEPGIEASLANRAQMEAARLEQVHAEHRACLAILLQEHRAELHAQAEADAAHSTQLVRELLAEHRAELTRTADAHAGKLALVLSQHREEMEAMRAQQSEVAPAPPNEALSAALIEQARLQREAHDDIAQHIAAVTTVVADLGQTVGLLAVAVYDGRTARIPTVSLPPPPRVGGTVGGVATATMTALGVSGAMSSPVPAASQPEVGRKPDAANVGTSTLAPSSAAPPPCNASVPQTDTGPPGDLSPKQVTPATEDALARGRMADLVNDDDDDLSGVFDPESRAEHPRLAPVTPIPSPNVEATHV